MGRRETRRNEARSGARGARDVTYRGKRLGVGGSIGSSAWRCKREVTVCGRWPAGLYIDEEVAMADGSVLRQVRVPEGKTRPSRLRETCWHARASRSEEHTSELQSRENLVWRLLLEKKKYIE